MNRTGSADQAGRRPSRSKTRASRKYSIMSCNSRSWLGTSVVEVLIFAAHKPVDHSGYQRENSSRAASIRYVEASRPIGVFAESMDIAWEWLRRDANYQSDYQSLENAQRLSDTTETFRQQWGLSFRR
jgi:hypothetical protein